MEDVGEEAVGVDWDHAPLRDVLQTLYALHDLEKVQRLLPVPVGMKLLARFPEVKCLKTAVVLLYTEVDMPDATVLVGELGVAFFDVPNVVCAVLKFLSRRRLKADANALQYIQGVCSRIARMDPEFVPTAVAVCMVDVLNSCLSVLDDSDAAIADWLWMCLPVAILVLVIHPIPVSRLLWWVVSRLNLNHKLLGMLVQPIINAVVSHRIIDPVFIMYAGRVLDEIVTDPASLMPVLRELGSRADPSTRFADVPDKSIRSTFRCGLGLHVILLVDGPDSTPEEVCSGLEFIASESRAQKALSFLGDGFALMQVLARHVTYPGVVRLGLHICATCNMMPCVDAGACTLLLSEHVFDRGIVLRLMTVLTKHPPTLEVTTLLQSSNFACAVLTYLRTDAEVTELVFAAIGRLGDMQRGIFDTPMEWMSALIIALERHPARPGIVLPALSALSSFILKREMSLVHVLTRIVSSVTDVMEQVPHDVGVQVKCVQLLRALIDSAYWFWEEDVERLTRVCTVLLRTMKRHGRGNPALMLPALGCFTYRKGHLLTTAALQPLTVGLVCEVGTFIRQSSGVAACLPVCVALFRFVARLCTVPSGAKLVAAEFNVLEACLGFVSLPDSPEATAALQYVLRQVGHVDVQVSAVVKHSVKHWVESVVHHMQKRGFRQPFVEAITKDPSKSQETLLRLFRVLFCEHVVGQLKRACVAYGRFAASSLCLATVFILVPFATYFLERVPRAELVATIHGAFPQTLGDDSSDEEFDADFDDPYSPPWFSSVTPAVIHDAFEKVSKMPLHELDV